MSLLDRVKDLMSANLNDLLSSAEDPEKMANEYLRQLDEQYYQAKSDVAQAMADENRLHQKMLEHQAEVQKWQTNAETALRAGKEDLAKQALVRKTQAQSLANQYEQQFKAQDEQVDALEDALALLEVRISETKARRDLIIAKKNRAQTQESIQSTARAMSKVTALDKLDALEDRVDDQLAKAEAMAELETDSLDSQFKKLEEETGVDSELAELKQKLGIS